MAVILMIILMLANEAEVTAADVSCPASCQCKQKITNCSGANYQSVPGNLPRDSKKIYLDHMGLSSIENTVVNWLDVVEMIDLSNNKIEEINGMAFQGLHNLQSLRLNNNKLSSLSKKPFKDMENLERLYLNDNSLAALPYDVFEGLDNLKILNLNNNNFKEIPHEAFHNIPNLQELHMRNAVAAAEARQLIEPDFEALHNLLVLTLSKNSINAVDKETFTPMSHLTTLDLSGNRIRDLGFISHSRLPKLKTLKLHGNKLANTRNETFMNLPSLEQINLSDNQLTELPHISNKSELIVLGFARNSFDCSCDNVAKFSIVCSLTGERDLYTACLNCTGKGYLISPRNLTGECAPAAMSVDITTLVMIVLITVIVLLILLILIAVLVVRLKKKKGQNRQQSAQTNIYQETDTSGSVDQSVSELTTNGHLYSRIIQNLHGGAVVSSADPNYSRLSSPPQGHTYARIRDSWATAYDTDRARSRTVIPHYVNHTLRRSATQNTIQFPYDLSDTNRHYEEIKHSSFSSMQDLSTGTQETSHSNPYMMAIDDTANGHVAPYAFASAPYAFASTSAVANTQNETENGRYMTSLT